MNKHQKEINKIAKLLYYYNNNKEKNNFISFYKSRKFTRKAIKKITK